jgi:hypothetical protein
VEGFWVSGRSNLVYESSLVMVVVYLRMIDFLYDRWDLRTRSVPLELCARVSKRSPFAEAFRRIEGSQQVRRPERPLPESPEEPSRRARRARRKQELKRAQAAQQQQEADASARAERKRLQALQSAFLSKASALTARPKPELRRTETKSEAEARPGRGAAALVAGGGRPGVAGRASPRASRRACQHVRVIQRCKMCFKICHRIVLARSRTRR